jgi:SAM-dependent methyltransferase
MNERAAQPAYFSQFDPTGGKAADAARQILETTRPFRSTPDRDLIILDIGCGYGYTSVSLARTCRRVVAIEPSPGLYQLARSTVRDSGVTNVEVRPVGVEAVSERSLFDLVVLDNVLEHIGDQRQALRTIADTMNQGAVLYLLVPNKLWPLEPHYGLPFLSYLPLSWANRYLRLTKRGSDYTDASYAPTYGRLVTLLSAAGLDAHFVVPSDLSLTVGGAAWHYRVGASVLRRVPCLWRFAKGFLVVAVKRRDAEKETHT